MKFGASSGLRIKEGNLERDISASVLDSRRASGYEAALI